MLVCSFRRKEDVRKRDRIWEWGGGILVLLPTPFSCPAFPSACEEMTALRENWLGARPGSEHMVCIIAFDPHKSLLKKRFLLSP